VSSRIPAPPAVRPGGASPQPAPLRPYRDIARRRRRPGMIGLAVALTVLGALLAGYLAQTAGRKVPVLALTRPVAYGAQIQQADLAEVRIAADPTVARISARERASVIGQYAAMPLAQGALLIPGSITGQPLPKPGNQLVGVALTRSQMPGGDLEPGRSVLLVATPGPGASSPDSSPATTPATVVRVNPPDQNGVTVVDVEVSAGQGPALAARVATGRIALVVQPPPTPQTVPQLSVSPPTQVQPPASQSPAAQSPDRQSSSQQPTGSQPAAASAGQQPPREG